jgi:putative membrane protein
MAHGARQEVTSGTSLWDGLALSVLLLIGGLYAAGSWRLGGRRVKRRQLERVAFWAGWLAMVAAIVPPLDGLAAQLFSAHMLQHELLMIVGAPLVVAGRPLSACLWGMPGRSRVMAAAVLQQNAPGSLWRFLTTPLVAWFLHGLVVWIWHVPALYSLAIRDEAVHAVQHATFVGTSVFFWWGLVYGRYGRAGYGAAVFYVFTTAVHTGVLGALFTFTPSPIYSIYVQRASAHGVDPLADQQLAGLVMWIPAGIVLTMAGVALFAAWLGEAERRSRHPSTIKGHTWQMAAQSAEGQRSQELTGGATAS